MREVPVVGLAIHGGILPHRRHHDAIGKFKAAQLYRGKQGTHGGIAGQEEGTSCFYLMRRGAFLNRAWSLGSGRTEALNLHLTPFSTGEPVATPDQVRGRLSLENALLLDPGGLDQFHVSGRFALDEI